MRILSLFDGISCGMVALERAGIPVERYVAYEIDDDAIAVSKANYPEIIHKGDVFEAVYEEGQYDLLIGGSPCTNWSVARGGNGRETQASGIGWDLFSEYVRALKTVKPKFFMYENNASMSDTIKNCISEELGCNPIEIDSADFSAQKRKRLYWTNIEVEKWKKSTITFADIMDDSYEKSRSIEKYKDTYKWSKDRKCLSWDTSGKGYYSQASRARIPNQKWNTVCANRAESKGNVYLGGDMIRLVTMSELEKLQTLPVGYTACLKNKEKRGKGIGNGWTVDVIAHIFKGLKGDKMLTEKNDYTDCINIIRNLVPDREMLEQLAEEAAELAQAAIKVIRAGEMARGLPTPVKYDEAFENLVEEASDIKLILDIMGIYTTEPKENPKALRWYNRLIESGIPTEG